MVSKKGLYSTEEDGINHINIYSRGKTRLGRELSNFQGCGINMPYGRFNTIEGLYHYLKIMRAIGVDSRRLEDISSDDEYLRFNLARLYCVNGREAKSIGKRLRTYCLCHGYPIKDTPDDKFDHEIIDAIGKKINSIPGLRTAIADNELEYSHYYVSDDGKTIYMPHFGWMVDVVLRAIDSTVMCGEDVY